MQLYNLPPKIFLRAILPLLSYSDVLGVAGTCGAMRRYLDRDAVWRALVVRYEIPWLDDDFIEQDAGGTSVRCMLEERMTEVWKFKHYDRESKKEILVDPKGLLQSVAAEMGAPYHVIDIGAVD